jgi:hypothetical protein
MTNLLEKWVKKDAPSAGSSVRTLPGWGRAIWSAALYRRFSAFLFRKERKAAEKRRTPKVHALLSHRRRCDAMSVAAKNRRKIEENEGKRREASRDSIISWNAENASSVVRRERLLC